MRLEVGEESCAHAPPNTSKPSWVTPSTSLQLQPNRTSCQTVTQKIHHSSEYKPVLAPHLTPRTDKTAWLCCKSLIAGLIWKGWSTKCYHAISKRLEKHRIELLGSIKCGPCVTWAQFQNNHDSYFSIPRKSFSTLHNTGNEFQLEDERANIKVYEVQPLCRFVSQCWVSPRHPGDETAKELLGQGLGQTAAGQRGLIYYHGAVEQVGAENSRGKDWSWDEFSCIPPKSWPRKKKNKLTSATC